MVVIHLPQMRCDDGCGKCCGIVLCTGDEYLRVVNYAKLAGIKPVRQGATCPWFQGGRCAVYPARPFPCRMFGHSPRLVCPHGYNENVSEEVEQKLVERYRSGRRKNDRARCLHEVCHSVDDIESIMQDASRRLTDETRREQV